DLARHGHDRGIRFRGVQCDVATCRLHLELTEHRVQPDVARGRLHGHLAERAGRLQVGGPAREVEIRARRAGDPTLEVAAPRDLDRTPAKPVLLLDPDEVATAPLIHRHLDLVDGVLTTATEGDDLDCGARLVGGRHDHTTTREPDLEGDARGSLEDVHRAALLLAAGRSANARTRGRTRSPAAAVADLEDGGVVERKSGE